MTRTAKNKTADRQPVRAEAEAADAIHFQCIDAIQVGLCIEKEGLSFYEKACRFARDRGVKEIFSRLADEEREHIRLLQDKGRYLQPALSRKTDRADVKQFIMNRIKGKVFPVGRGKEGDATVFRSDLDALKFGVESEARSITVLDELMREEKKIDVRAIFQHLLVEEKRHKQALEAARAELESSQAK